VSVYLNVNRTDLNFQIIINNTGISIVLIRQKLIQDPIKKYKANSQSHVLV